MSRAIKKSVLVTYDSLAILFSSILAYIFLDPYIKLSISRFFITVGLIISIYLVLAVYFKLFSKINRYTSIKESMVIGSSVSAAYLLSSMILLLIQQPLSFRFIVLGYLFSVGLIVGSRIGWRIYHEHHYRKNNHHVIERQIPTLVIGAGHGGSIFVRSLKHNDSDVHVIGILDDDSSKNNMLLYDVPVL